jgi:hypothetical protein
MWPSGQRWIVLGMNIGGDLPEGGEKLYSAF